MQDKAAPQPNDLELNQHSLVPIVFQVMVERGVSYQNAEEVFEREAVWLLYHSLSKSVQKCNGAEPKTLKLQQEEYHLDVNQRRGQQKDSLKSTLMKFEDTVGEA